MMMKVIKMKVMVMKVMMMKVMKISRRMKKNLKTRLTYLNWKQKRGLKRQVRQKVKQTVKQKAYLRRRTLKECKSEDHII